MAITLLCDRLADGVAVALRNRHLDGATPWQMFKYITYPLLTPIIAVVMTFSVLVFTFTDFQLIWVLTRGGPSQCHAPDGHAQLPVGHPGRQAGRRGRGGHRDGPVPAGQHSHLVVRPATAQMAARGRQ
ncbi:MAG: hypothetical protein R3E68_15090 [Burkholderiaceae bacterium]